MADRETRDFTSPGGHTIVLNTYLTGRESNELKSLLMSAMKMNVESAQTGKVDMGKLAKGLGRLAAAKPALPPRAAHGER